MPEPDETHPPAADGAGAGADPGPLEVVRDFAARVDDVSASGRYVVARISTDGVDRFQTVVVPGGVTQKTFEQNNRLVLWEHGKDPTRGRLPIGRSDWVKHRRDRGDLLARTTFARDDYSQQVFELYRDGLLRGWSVNGNADPQRTGPPTAAELRARPDWAGARTVYRAVDLKEYSGVTHAGNADALTEEVGRSLAAAVARGLWVPDDLRARLAGLPPLPPPPAKPELPPLRGRTLDEVRRSLERRSSEAARRLLRQALQDARDLARGRV